MAHTGMGSRFSQRTRVVLGLTAACALLVPLVAAAGGNLLVAAGIRGSSTLVGFEQQIEARAISFSASAPSGGQPALGPITVTKNIDDATPVFLDALSKGKVFTSIVISNAVLVGGRVSATERYTLTNVRVTDQRIADSANSGRGSEQLTLIASSLKMEGTVYDPNSGNKVSGTVGTIP